MTSRSWAVLGMIAAAGSCSSKDQLLQTRDAAADALAMGGSGAVVATTGGAGSALAATGGAGGALFGTGGTPTAGISGAAGSTNAGGALATSSGGAAGTSASGGTTGAGGRSGLGGASAASLCGNGTRDPGEDCDQGGLNGAFYGDGSGCALNCTKEPVCRDGSGHNRACAAVCGDGNLDAGEGCDDGNRTSGDGCSSACAIEAGYTCSSVPRSATVGCRATGGTSNNDGCVQLAATYRDFKSNHESGGHPDFPYLSPTTPCVPDASGPSHCGVATPRTWGIVQDALLNGKPQLNGSPTGACSFVDWSHDTNGGHVPGYTSMDSPLSHLPYVAGPNGHPSFSGTVALVKDKSSFDQWFNDSSGSSPPSAHTVGLLELGSIGGGAYQFSSGLDAITGGFYPVDPPGALGPGSTPAGEPMLCNLWPYWYSSSTFGAGNACRGDQFLLPPSIPMTVQTALNCASQTPPGCITGAWVTNDQGLYHDFWFTYEIHTTVTLPSSGFQLQVYATNDLFVFLNGVLVLDLGGTHGPLPARLSVDGTTGTAVTTEGGFLDLGHVTTACPSGDPADPMNSKQCPLPKQGDDCRTRTLPLGLKAWQTYELAIFGAQRHPTQSTFEIVTSGVQKLASACTKP